MKYLFFTLLLLFSNLVFCQNETFKYDFEGFNRFVVVNIDSTSKEVLYKKALEWISKTYTNPDKVINAKIENEYIRITGTTYLLERPGIGNNKYQIEISFKENRYKFEVISLDYYKTASHRGAISAWWPEEYLDPEKCFKKDNEVRGFCKKFVIALPKYFNDLNNSLKDYIENKRLTKKDDW